MDDRSVFGGHAVFRPDSSAMSAQDVTGDRQAQPRTRRAPGAIGAVEALEDAVKVGRRDPRATVKDREHDPGAIR